MEVQRLTGKAALARSVHPGGLAANSKRVRPGDILVSLNDQPVEGKTLVEVHNAIQVFIFIFVFAERMSIKINRSKNPHVHFRHQINRSINIRC